MTSPFEGSGDAMENGSILGWAWNPEDPSAHVTVEFLVNGAEKFWASCELQRADLLAAGKGFGDYGFEVPLPDELNDVGYLNIEARIVDSDCVLHGSPVVWNNGNHGTQHFPVESLPWLDQPDADEQLQALRISGEIDTGEHELLAHFRENGFIRLQGAIEEDVIDQFLEDVERAWRERPVLKTTTMGLGERFISELPNQSEMPNQSYRFMDFHNLSEAAAEMMMDPRILRLLSFCLGNQPVAMQSLTFEYGTEQRAHQDFCYVHTPRPAVLAAAWIACEDVQEDAGPLFYYPASHRAVPKYSWTDGLLLTQESDIEVHGFEQYLMDTSPKLGLEKVTFMPKKGDVLIWHSALVHGGSPRKNTEKTRRSFACHYSTSDVYQMDRRTNRKPKVIERNGGLYHAWQEKGHHEGLYGLKN